MNNIEIFPPIKTTTDPITKKQIKYNVLLKREGVKWWAVMDAEGITFKAPVPKGWKPRLSK